jgi:hypothetical protein
LLADFYILPNYKQMTILVGSNLDDLALSTIAELQQHLIGNHPPRFIVAMNGRFGKFYLRSLNGTYVCEDSVYPEQYGIGLGRTAECGRGLLTDDVVDGVREFFLPVPAPAQAPANFIGGRRHNRSRKHSNRRKHRSRRK